MGATYPRCADGRTSSNVRSTRSRRSEQAESGCRPDFDRVYTNTAQRVLVDENITCVSFRESDSSQNER